MAKPTDNLAASDPSPARRVRLPHDERRRQLVGIGLRAFADRPLDELKIEDVAREAGISRGLLFYYFPTKRAYYLAVIEAAAKRMFRLLSVPPDLDGHDALRYALRQYFDLVERRAEAYALLAHSAASADPDVAAIWEGARGRVAGLMLDALGRDDSHARLLVRGWLAMVESFALDWVRERPVERDELIEELIGTLDHALARAGVRIPKEQA